MADQVVFRSLWNETEDDSKAYQNLRMKTKPKFSGDYIYTEMLEELRPPNQEKCGSKFQK